MNYNTYGFNESVKKALNNATELVRSSGHSELGTEHLLFGILSVDSMAKKLLEQQSITQAAFLLIITCSCMFRPSSGAQLVLSVNKTWLQYHMERWVVWRAKQSWKLSPVKRMWDRNPPSPPQAFIVKWYHSSLLSCQFWVRVSVSAPKGPLVQWSERPAHNRGVVGSSPTRTTTQV